MPFFYSFPHFIFYFTLIFLRFFLSFFVVLPVPLPCPLTVRFVPFRLAVFRLFLATPFFRFSFRFPAFLGGGFCYSVSSPRRCTHPPALLASLKYAYSPCVLSSCVVDVDLFLCFFSSFHFFSISIWTSFVSSCLFLVGTIILSPRFRFLLRLV